MGFYKLIHWVSLVLAGATLAILLVVVMRQAFRNRRVRRDAARRQSLMALALEYIEEPEFIPAFKAQLQPAISGCSSSSSRTCCPRCAATMRKRSSSSCGPWGSMIAA